MTAREILTAEPMEGLPDPGHRATALVIGYGPSVQSDLQMARRMRPDATLLGVKYAVAISPEIVHVWSQHAEQCADIRARAGRPIFVHVRKPEPRRRRLLRALEPYESDIDYLWPALHWVCGSSGFSAALWARHGLGFSEAILCGVPLMAAGYTPEVAAFKPVAAEGGTSFIDLRVIVAWRELIGTYIKDGLADGITSMSGWTRDNLGAPCPEQQEAVA